MDLPIEDWDELFKAVQARLRLTVEQATDAARLREVVLECVDALSGLHAALHDERFLRKGVAIELVRLHDTLADELAEAYAQRSGLVSLDPRTMLSRR